jgi:hypothetical protein
MTATANRPYLLDIFHLNPLFFSQRIRSEVPALAPITVCRCLLAPRRHVARPPNDRDPPVKDRPDGVARVTSMAGRARSATDCEAVHSSGRTRPQSCEGVRGSCSVSEDWRMRTEVKADPSRTLHCVDLANTSADSTSPGARPRTTTGLGPRSLATQGRPGDSEAHCL